MASFFCGVEGGGLLYWLAIKRLLDSPIAELSAPGFTAVERSDDWLDPRSCRQTD